ncbi:MAG TPA: hypothetical protein VG317_11265 [Pseudonocardiaceae bacterium]|nr:hypothetical protein [Pseudonocardiaceae bacterium]
MKYRRTLALAAVPAAAALLALSASPALADTTTPYTYPSTPVPSTQPGSPPASAPSGPQPLGHAVGDAATGLAVFRLLPGAVPTTSILGSVAGAPPQSLAEAGFGLSDARANSESYLNYEHAIAQSCPGGIAAEGNTPQLPGCLSQTASPDNPNALTNGYGPPSTPLDALLKVGLLNGSVHARWSDSLGPCVGTIADASTSLASVSAINGLSALPTTTTADALSSLMSQSTLSPADKQSLVNSLSQMGSLASLGGLLSSPGTANSATGSLINLPNTLSSHSVVRLVDIPGSPNKAVQSVSTMQVASVQLLPGPMAIDLNVVSQPTLTVTSTGDPKTSSVQYTAPVIQVVQGGNTLYTLDAAHPTQDVPIGIPTDLGAGNLPKLPVIGDLLPNGQPLTSAVPVIDIGALRLSIASLDQSSQSLTAGQNGAPFTGYQLSATARMLDLQVLPTAALGIPNLPAALAEVSLGEQIGRAYTPTSGVVCASTTAATGAGPAAPVSNNTPTLAYTDGAYHVVPLFWFGSAMLLIGVVLVAALPRRPQRIRRQPPVSPGGES